MADSPRGSLTILSATPESKDVLEHRVAGLAPGFQVLPIQISAAGLQVRGTLQP